VDQLIWNKALNSKALAKHSMPSIKGTIAFVEPHMPSIKGIQKSLKSTFFDHRKWRDGASNPFQKDVKFGVKMAFNCEFGVDFFETSYFHRQ